MDTLAQFGWNDQLAAAWQQVELEGVQPGRVVADFGTSLKVAMPGIVTAELTGKLAHYTPRDQTPKVGDWVAVRPSDNGNVVIEAVLPRRNDIARKAAGKRTIRQVMAANIDVAFVLLALDNDFSIERLKRYLYQLSADHINAVIVLNKADKTNDLDAYLEQLRSFSLPIITITATEGTGVDAVATRIAPGQTAVLLGSSGVGKSTLTNELLGRAQQAVQTVRESDDTGKHTTVHRELFVLPNGGLLIDSPGIRELQLWGTDDDLAENFEDIIALAAQCAYTTCQHNGEAGCAVEAALARGTLEPAHYASYQAMRRELKTLDAKHTERARLQNKKSHRAVSKQEKRTLREMRDDF